MTGVLSLGLTGSVDHALLRSLAPRLEAAGFHALWLNDAGRGDALAGLAAAAEVTSTLVLATGVLPLDRLPAGEIAASVERLALPVDRLVLGVGSGAGARPLQLVTRGMADLRGVSDAAIVLGALGPRMRALGTRMAEGLLLSWLTPAAAAAAVADARAAADELGRNYPRAVLYARTAVDAAAQPGLDADVAAYGSYRSYAANFARLGFGPAAATIGPDAVGDRVGEYVEVVDELVLRAITPSGSLDDLLRFVEHAELQPRLRSGPQPPR
ncbi:MAG TPA: LLM class flavin-dependent oxidoreductase [Pseudolysinimonas sp.]|nr:LLM class flavin-dependent oxidoreductase [Pseudolysinimonas sp.]